MTPDKVCIIGAGSSGIAACKVLKQRGIPFICYEAGSKVGGNWRYLNDNGMSAAYKSLHINTSKTMMAYSDFPMPESYPDFPNHFLIADYFDSYVKHFGFGDGIVFNCKVTELTRTADGLWEVATEKGTREKFKTVIVANGHHWDPKRATFPGAFNGTQLHSHDYKTPDILTDKNVLVVGIGNSAVDIACESSRVAKSTWISTRRSAHVFPKYFLGKPADTFIKPGLSKMPMWFQRWLVNLALNITVGNQENYGVKRPPHAILQEHPTISSDLLHYVGHGKVKMKPNIAKLDGDFVEFVDGTREKIDVIVYATGYNITFPFIKPELLNFKDNRILLYRRVVHPDLPGLYFLGLVQPLGAIMPLAEKQSEWIADLLKGICRLPDKDAMLADIGRMDNAVRQRYVDSNRHTIQVDFFPYIEEIEKERQQMRAG